MYILVEFTDNSEIEVILENWLDGNNCAVWPPYKTPARLKKAVQNKKDPADYQKTRAKLNLAEEESDLLSDHEETKRKKRPNPRFKSEEESPTKVRSKKQTETETETRQPQLDMPLPQAPPIPNLTLQMSSSSKNHDLPLPQAPPRHNLTFQMSSSSKNHETTPTQPASTCTSTLTTPTSTPIIPKSTVRPSGDISVHEKDIRLFKLLEEIKAEQKAQRILLSNIATQMSTERTECLCPENIQVPLTSLAEVDHLESQLSDQSVAKLLVDHLSSVGGSTLKIMTKRVMKKVMTSSLATNFNWTGAKGKRPFKALKIATVILRAVRRNFPQQSNNETEIVVKDWLRNAKDRDGGRKNRMKQQDDRQDDSDD